jgi:hypothetical protein
MYYFLNFIFNIFVCFDIPKIIYEQFYVRELEEMCSKCQEICNKTNRAAIQKRGSILALMVNLSVYGADTIAIDLSLSALIS